MTRILLIAMAILYGLLGCWSLLAPEQVANGVHLSWHNASGRSEFLTVYGGLELGLAAGFLLGAVTPRLQAGVLAMACCSSLGLLLVRTGSMLPADPLHGVVWILFATELALSLATGLAWWHATARRAEPKAS
ncbi:MAG: DUF4345 family protein [Planctomycetota bacterium]